jgi:hypothetical protein
MQNTLPAKLASTLGHRYLIQGILIEEEDSVQLISSLRKVFSKKGK